MRQTMSHYILFRLIPGNIVFGAQKRKDIQGYFYCVIIRAGLKLFLQKTLVTPVNFPVKNIFVFLRHLRHIYFI